MAALIDDMRRVEGQLGKVDGTDFATIREHLTAGVEALEQATEWLLQTIGRDPDTALAASFSF